MTRVGGPPPGVVPSALPQGAPITVVLSDLPAALRNLTLGAFLTGTVLERNGSGITMLQTGAGVFGIKTTVPLPTGSTVTLQVQSAGAQMQAIVLSVTPQGASAKAPMPLPTQPATPLSALPPAPPPITSNAPPAPAIVDRPVIASTAITATVIGPAGGPAPALPSAPAPPAALPAPVGATAPNAGTGDAPAGSVAANAPRPVPDAPTANAAQTAVYQRQMSIVSSASPAPPAPAPAGTLAPAPTPSPSAGAPQSPAAPVVPERAATASSPAPDKPLAPLPSGTQVQIRLVPGEPGAARPATPTAPTVSATPATPTGPTSTAPVARGVSSGVTPPPNAAPAPSGAQATAAHQTVAATIVARTPAGQTILDTPVGRILAALPRMVEKAAPGTRIQLELLTAERGTGTPRPTIAASGPSAIAREWPGLRDALKLVQDSAAPEMRAAFDRALPKPGPQLARQMLAFVDAATQGGVRTWLGEGIARIIERLGGGELVNRLDHDLRDMLATQRSDGDWRMTIIPMLDGRELRQIRFFERRRKRDEKERRREDSARFVVECEHSEFGALQIDGLMNEKRLDLILRSHDPLPQEMERDILALFGNACTGLGLNGQLFFQAVPVFPVSPLEDLSHNAVQVSI